MLFMKYLFSLLIILFFTNCKKSLNEDSANQDFIVSKHKEKYDKLIESFMNRDSTDLEEGIEVSEPDPEPSLFDKKLNQNYTIGSIHFMILDTSTTYYYINDLEPKFTCGTGHYQEMTIEDSINYIVENSKQIPFSKKIKTNQISEVLNQYKKEILNDFVIPFTISFASKHDTIKGEIMPNLFSFMEQNGMNSYFIRRFNEAEINANFK